MKITVAVAALLAAGVALATAACVAPAGGTAAGHSSAGSTTVATSTPHPAFVGGTDAAPVIVRKGALPPSQRAVAPVAPFDRPATWSDGVTLTASKFARGSVSGSGTGVIKTTYVVFTLTLNNRSSKALDLSSVVVTMLSGADNAPASPEYDGVQVHDFSGVLQPGHSATARYAFQIEAGVTRAQLYVDTDGTRIPAHFSGGIPS